MKKFAHIIAFTLAANFLAVAGGLGWLWQSGRLDHERVHAIREIVFPPDGATIRPSTQPASDQGEAGPTTQQTLELDEVLAHHAGRSVASQVEYMQQSFDAQMATLDRRQRELGDLRRQVELAKQQAEKDRAELDAQRAALVAREAESSRLAENKGFQETLALYQSMPPKQAKAVFLTLDDATVMRYLQSMEPRSASKILKEFKTPAETARVQRVLERMREAQPSAEGMAGDGSVPGKQQNDTDVAKTEPAEPGRAAASAEGP